MAYLFPITSELKFRAVLGIVAVARLEEPTEMKTLSIEARK